MATASYAVLLQHFQKSYRQIVHELGKVIIGQRGVLDQILAAILAAATACWWACRGWPRP